MDNTKRGGEYLTTVPPGYAKRQLIGYSGKVMSCSRHSLRVSSLRSAVKPSQAIPVIHDQTVVPDSHGR
jgi:hypothetical protein